MNITVKSCLSRLSSILSSGRAAAVHPDGTVLPIASRGLAPRQAIKAPRDGQRWTVSEAARARVALARKEPIEMIAKRHGRTIASIGKCASNFASCQGVREGLSHASKAVRAVAKMSLAQAVTLAKKR